MAKRRNWGALAALAEKDPRSFDNPDWRQWPMIPTPDIEAAIIRGLPITPMPPRSDPQDSVRPPILRPPGRIYYTGSATAARVSMQPGDAVILRMQDPFNNFRAFGYPFYNYRSAQRGTAVSKVRDSEYLVVWCTLLTECAREEPWMRNCNWRGFTQEELL